MPERQLQSFPTWYESEQVVLIDIGGSWPARTLAAKTSPAPVPLM
jgi:hypothetical protein